MMKTEIRPKCETKAKTERAIFGSAELALSYTRCVFTVQNLRQPYSCELWAGLYHGSIAN